MGDACKSSDKEPAWGCMQLRVEGCCMGVACKPSDKVCMQTIGEGLAWRLYAKPLKRGSCGAAKTCLKHGLLRGCMQDPVKGVCIVTAGKTL